MAVATGSNVYVYRNLRPYFKFALPPVTIHATETSVWADVSAGTIDASKAVELLSAARCVPALRCGSREWLSGLRCV